MSDSEVEEQPLDPALERVRQKLMRLMIISIGILMVGIFGVLGAVIYRLNTNSTEDKAQQAWVAGEPALETRLELAPEDSIKSYEVTGRRLVIEVEGSNGQISFVIVDLGSGGIVSKVVP